MDGERLGGWSEPDWRDGTITNVPSPSVSASSSTGDPHTPKVCVRCFRLWKRCIQDGEEDLPNCIFLNSSRSKKCRYCSERRSECVPVSQPVSLRFDKHDSSRMKILMPLMNTVIERRREWTLLWPGDFHTRVLCRPFERCLGSFSLSRTIPEPAGGQEAITTAGYIPERGLPRRNTQQIPESHF